MNLENSHIRKPKRRDLTRNLNRQKVTMTMEEAALFVATNNSNFYVCPTCGFIHTSYM